MSPSSKDIAHLAEEQRDQLTATLDELRARLSPSRMIDETFGFVKQNGSAVASNFGLQARNNPLPLLLLGLGCAIFLAASRTGKR